MNTVIGALHSSSQITLLSYFIQLAQIYLHFFSKFYKNIKRSKNRNLLQYTWSQMICMQKKSHLRTCEAMSNSGSPPHIYGFLILETCLLKSPSMNLTKVQDPWILQGGKKRLTQMNEVGILQKEKQIILQLISRIRLMKVKKLTTLFLFAFCQIHLPPEHKISSSTMRGFQLTTKYS